MPRTGETDWPGYLWMVILSLLGASAAAGGLVMRIHLSRKELNRQRR
jgi:hypothetical protein